MNLKLDAIIIPVSDTTSESGVHREFPADRADGAGQRRCLI